VVRNIPLVVLLALMALLFWPSEQASEVADLDAADLGGKANGAHPPAGNAYHREAA
jgi:hypothetical protein